jgi:hypothetical protein
VSPPLLNPKTLSGGRGEAAPSRSGRGEGYTQLSSDEVVGFVGVRKVRKVWAGARWKPNFEACEWAG